MMRITVNDNSFSEYLLTESQLYALSPYAGISLEELTKKEKDLLIFPHSFGAHEDAIGKQTLFDIVGGKLKTGNVMGFFCIDDIQIAIHSRFDSSDKQFFLHYMLQKVLGINILNFENHMGPDELREFLIYIFPYCLERALRQGLFRAYRQYECNDSKVKGAVDVARHLKLNLPFNGKIAYRVREYSADNPVMQLIRHTIEFIRCDHRRSTILRSNAEIKEAVEQVVEVTPSYNDQDRQKVIFHNLRGSTHPYFIEYTFLRNLCLRILRHDKVSAGSDDQHIKGIVFDGAWLWEEYLATILRKLGFEHPENKTGKGRSYLFTDNSGWIYPDFIGKNAVLDAKYKPLVINNISREDRFQMISYMHVLEKNLGYLVHPTQNDCAAKEHKILNGYGGEMGTLTFCVPNSTDWIEYCSLMKESEKTFCENVLKYTSICKSKIGKFAAQWQKKFTECSNDTGEKIFADECSALGFKLDMGTSLKSVFPEIEVEKPEGLKAIINSIEDVELLGTAIFSYWRWRCKLEWGIIHNDETREWMLTALNRLIELTKS